MSYLLLHWHEVVYLLLAIIFVAIYVVHFLPGMKDSKLKKILEVETILMAAHFDQIFEVAAGCSGR